MIGNHRKKVAVVYQQITMANSPVDRNAELMQQEFGTKVLITDLAADRLLEKAAKENPAQKKFTEFCGKQNGWDDYTERWH